MCIFYLYILNKPIKNIQIKINKNNVMYIVECDNPINYKY